MDGCIVCAHGREEKVLAKLDAIPLTFGGTARFNVENVLGAVAAARALGLGDDAILRGIEGFTPAENPRRTALVERNGTRILLDFGHNADGVRSVLKLVRSLRRGGEGRLFVITGSAGDRSDRELEEIARAIHEAGPTRVFLRELPKYLRGRQPGEVPEVFRRAFVSLGFEPSAIAFATSEVGSLDQALKAAEPGDFIVLLVHLEHDEVRAFLG